MEVVRCDYFFDFVHRVFDHETPDNSIGRTTIDCVGELLNEGNGESRENPFSGSGALSALAGTGAQTYAYSKVGWSGKT